MPIDADKRIVVLVDGNVAEFQARFPKFEFMAKDTDPETLKGREIRVLVDQPEAPKRVLPKSMKQIVQEYAAGRHFVSVHDVIWNVLGIGKWPYQMAYEMQIVRVLQQMGWTRARLRNGPYRQTAYIPPSKGGLPTLDPVPDRSLMQNRPRGSNR